MSISSDYFTNHHGSSCSPNIESFGGELASLMPFGELISFACNKELSQQHRSSSSNFNISKTHRLLDIKEEVDSHNNLCENLPHSVAVNENPITLDVDGSKENISQGGTSYGSNEDRQVTTVPDRSRMPWKKRYCQLSSEPDHHQHGNPTELEVSLTKNKSQKRKRASSLKEDEGNEAVPSKKTLLSSVDETIRDNNSWIVKGVVVKTLQYGRPMATIIEVSEDKTACTLQFFSGWKAGVFTKYIAPV